MTAFADFALARENIPSAPASRRGKLDGIEAARGIASVIVVLYHASNHVARNVGFKPLGGVAQFGHAGVDFFFVLSGFIIWFVHADDIGRPNRLSHYAQRRFTRIYPIYWVVTLLTLLLGMTLSSHTQPVGEALYGATLLPTFDEPYIGVAWTLQHEMMFYAMFAIAIIRAAAGVVAFSVWLTIIAVVQLHGGSGDVLGGLGRLSSSFNVEFFLGILAAWLTRSGRIRHPREFLLGGLALFIAAAAAEDTGILDGFSVMGRVAYGIPAFLLVLGSISIAGSGGILSRVFMTLGRASYSIYLSHLLFIGIAYKAAELSGIFARLTPTVAWVGLSAAGIAGGVVVSRFIEYPLMDWIRSRIFGTRREFA